MHHHPPHRSEQPLPAHEQEAEESGATETAAEAAGGASGAIIGAAVGSFAGPIGAILGGIAGAVGGWWAGQEVAEDAARFGEEDERYYRTHWESLLDRPADASYERARPGYIVGRLAARHPGYRGRSFEEIEPELRHGWRGEQSGEWESTREYARHAYEREQGRADG